MKILTKEEEAAHYNATLQGGAIGGVLGLAVGGAGVAIASRRFPHFRALTVPFRAFLVASSTTFAGVIGADRASNAFDIANSPEKQREIQREKDRAALYESNKSAMQQAKDWATENRYPILFSVWVASMAGSWVLVNRSSNLSGTNKLVQARLYAQGLTLAALLASFAFETNDATKGKGRWETIKVIDPNDPEHKHIIEKKIHKESYAGEDQWRDMIEAEEQRLKARDKAVKARQHELEAQKKEEKHKDQPKKDNGGSDNKKQPKKQDDGKESSEDHKEQEKQ